MSPNKNIEPLTADKVTRGQARLLSLDVFRALNIFLMVFANGLSEKSFQIYDIPEGFRHATKFDTMTFPDVIWPAFAFMLGLSIPLAYQRRVACGSRGFQIWGHIIVRTGCLWGIGITTGHAWGGGNPLFMSSNLWAVLLFVSFFMIWSQHQAAKATGRAFAGGVRISGLVLLIFLVAIYRQGEDQTWMNLRWWLIGSLGWGYIVACILYGLFRKSTAGMLGSLALLTLLCVGDREDVFDQWGIISVFKQYVSLRYTLGPWGLMAVTGTLVGMLFTNDTSAKTPRQRIGWIGVFAVGLTFAGFCLRPLYGIAKSEYTPTWALYSMSISCILFAALYWLVDVKNIQKWAAPITPAGENALMPYFVSRMLHPLFALLHIESINFYFNTGVIGIVKTFILSLLLLLASAWLTKRGYLKLSL